MIGFGDHFMAKGGEFSSGGFGGFIEMEEMFVSFVKTPFEFDTFLERFFGDRTRFG